MKQVLIPIDGSDCALRAVARVIAKRSRYAHPEDLAIHLVNVQAPFSHEISRFVGTEQMAIIQREESEKAMAEACALLDTAEAGYTCHHKTGNIAEEITALADRLNCCQIVMGTHGRDALGEPLTGSITLKVIRLSKMPILLIK
jgi:nucleotide-binding universal stress UspA family protein